MVDDLVPLRLQVLLQMLGEVESGVVRAEVHPHAVSLDGPPLLRARIRRICGTPPCRRVCARGVGRSCGSAKEMRIREEREGGAA